VTNVSATVVFLGTGTSVGVPAIGCPCEVCQSDDPRNNRTRCAIAVLLPSGTLLVDTPPELRMQLLREKIPLVHTVLFTHEHVDHLYGLDDLRLFPFRLQRPVPLYCTEIVEQRIRHAFDYAFETTEPTHPGARPQLELCRIDPDQTFSVLGTSVTPIPLKHGPHFNVLGFRLGNFAYCTDTNFISDESIERLKGIETFVVGALRYEPHPTHFNIEEAIEVAKKVGARQTLFTHCGHDLDYSVVCDALPDGIDLAYDGLRLQIEVSIL
jgi:phosphoribosyl 1,2-cyclic phosphate phosphodiesterase